MGGHGLRPLCLGLSATLLAGTAAGIPGAALAADDCWGEHHVSLLEPPSGQSSFFVHVEWDDVEKYFFEYYVTTSPDPLGDPRDGQYVYWTGGCLPPLVDICAPLDPLVVTEHTAYYVDVNGNDASYPNASYGDVGEGASSYTLVAEPAGFCNYNTQPDPDGPLYGDIERLERTIAEAPATVPLTASIKSFAADGGLVFGPAPLTAEVPPGWGDPVNPGPHRRILGTFDWDPATGISNFHAAGPSTAITPDATADEPGTQVDDLPPLPPGVIAAAPPGPDDFSAPDKETPVEETAEERRRRATVLLAMLVVLGPGRFLEVAWTGDWEGALKQVEDLIGVEDSSEAVDPPTKSPPRMSHKARDQGWQWVWLPAETSVRKKGATHYLKPGVWYQTEVDKDGDRVFYKKNEKLIGRTRDEVQVKVWGKEAEPWEPSDDLPALFKDAMTDSAQPPGDPPPALPLKLRRGQGFAQVWVYVTQPTQSYSEEGEDDDLVKEHVLMPGRWYLAHSFGRRIADIYTADGQWLGDEPDRDYLQVSPTTPLQVDEPVD